MIPKITLIVKSNHTETTLKLSTVDIGIDKLSAADIGIGEVDIYC